MERAERLKRLHDLKSNMNIRASGRVDSDDGVVRMIRGDRSKIESMDEYGGRQGARRIVGSSNQDIIYMHKESDVQQLYNDNDGQDSNLPSIGS